VLNIRIINDSKLPIKRSSLHTVPHPQWEQPFRHSDSNPIKKRIWNEKWTLMILWQFCLKGSQQKVTREAPLVRGEYKYFYCNSQTRIATMRLCQKHFLVSIFSKATFYPILSFKGDRKRGGIMVSTVLVFLESLYVVDLSIYSSWW